MSDLDIDSVIDGGMIGKFNLSAVVEAIEASNKALHQLMHTMEDAGVFIMIAGVFTCAECGCPFATLPKALELSAAARDDLVVAMARVTDPTSTANAEEILMDIQVAANAAMAFDNFAM